MQARTAVAKVIQSCLDDERTLVEGCKRVDSQKSAVLTRLADERRRFAEDLERLNGQGSRESWGSLGRELESELWTRMAGPNASDVVATCRASQQRTEARYDKALALDLPDEVKAVLMTQLERVHAARDDLNEME
jgi:uncharacterized protein (TIGR02284 family)